MRKTASTSDKIIESWTLSFLHFWQSWRHPRRSSDGPTFFKTLEVLPTTTVVDGKHTALVLALRFVEISQSSVPAGGAKAGTERLSGRRLLHADTSATLPLLLLLLLRLLCLLELQHLFA